MRTSRESNRRRGQTLVLMALFLLIVLAGVMALTLDFGFVLLARRHMQTGVNSAALEASRNVDSDQDGQGDGRESARTLLRNVYDDNFDPTSNPTTVGAGISGSLVQGIGFRSIQLGDLTGGRDLYLRRSEYIYRPDPQTNESNQTHGDLVRGDYDLDPTLDLQHTEYTDYSRDDFESNDDGDAFLVRMRRTHNPDGLDQISGVSSSGDGLPLLMGRLAWMSALPADADYSIRRDGVTVRATAIADNKPALRVWPANGGDEFYGAIPYWICKSDFMTSTDPATNTRETPMNERLTHIGLEADFDKAALPETPVSMPGYVAVVDEALTPPRVIGFWLAPDPNATILLPNASPRLQDAWDVLGQLTPAEREAVFDSQQAVMEFVSEQQEMGNTAFPLLMAPALVRTVR